jgi:type II secretory pathway component PulC
MQHLVRAVAVLAVGMLAVGAGCAGTQTEDDREVAGQPPEEEPSDEMPAGPPVKTKNDIPERVKKQSDESDKSDVSDGSDGTDESDQSEGAGVITEAQRKRLLDKGPPYIFQVVQLEPAKKDGEFRGYEIVGAKPEAREAMSPQLEVGDVITSINGIAIERPKDYMKAWEKFAEGEDVHIDLLRDGDEREADWVVRADDSR